MFMQLGQKQKEYTGKFLLDISKIILAVFVIGGLLPGSKISGPQMLIAIIDAIIVFIAGIVFLKGDNNG